MTNDRRTKPESDNKTSVISSADLQYILDVNQKAVEIYVEVEKQNDQILKTLEYFKEVAANTEERLDSIKETESNIEELLKDDNAHDHNTIVDLLKSLTSDIKSLSAEIKELKTSETKTKDSIDIINKLIESEVKAKISEIDKNLFRLVIILGSAGIGTIFTILQTFVHK